MTSTVKAGIVLGLVVEVWTFIVIALGWHKDPDLLAMFYLVIVYQAGILFWGLRMTAKEGRTFGGQVVAGLTISAIGAAIIFVGSYVLVTTVFPNYFDEVREAGRMMLSAQGMSESEIQSQLDMMAPSQTPLMNSLAGVIGTLVTGLILSLIIGAFVKARPAASEAAPPAAS